MDRYHRAPPSVCIVSLVDGRLWKSEAAGSNPATQTSKNAGIVQWLVP